MPGIVRVWFRGFHAWFSDGLVSRISLWSLVFGLKGFMVCLRIWFEGFHSSVLSYIFEEFGLEGLKIWIRKEGHVLFNNALSTFLFMIIWLQTYDKGPLR